MARKVGVGKFLVADEFTVADIAVGSMLGMMTMVETMWGLIEYKTRYLELLVYHNMLEGRTSFRETKPVMFELNEKVA
jgi:glutathione S-transferase